MCAGRFVVTAESSGGSSAIRSTAKAAANASACRGVTMRRAPAIRHSRVSPRVHEPADDNHDEEELLSHRYG